MTVFELFQRTINTFKEGIDPPLGPPGEPAETREDRILKWIDPDKLGLEIGPSHNPIASKANGYDVRVLDHLDRESLIEKFRDEGIDTSDIEYVDYVWSGEPYAELIGTQTRFNWIVSSHNIEHVPDLIGFLTSCRDVLEVGGILSLAIPDYRYIFDTGRSPSTLASVIDAHLRKDTKPTAGSIAEFNLKYSTRGGLELIEEPTTISGWEFYAGLKRTE